MKQDRIISMPGRLMLRCHGHKKYVTMVQDNGPEMRISRNDAAAIYRGVMAAIKRIYAEKNNV